MIVSVCEKLLGEKRARTRFFLAHSLKKDRHVSQHAPDKMRNVDGRNKGLENVDREREYAFKAYCK
jgi:hypothetical protein